MNSPSDSLSPSTSGSKATNSSSSSSTSPYAIVYHVVCALYLVGCTQLLYWAGKEAFEIRLHAIHEYGRVIHEFDPYFNYRATEYLWQHGWRKFFTWFDYQSWYPLGRPVGTTIYPGMQFTTVFIKQYLLPDWSINDICCFLPAWFGTLATMSTAGLAYVCVQSTASKSTTKSIVQDVPIISTIYTKIFLPIYQAFCKVLLQYTGSIWGLPTFTNPPAFESAIATAFIMSIIPAHLLRSVGGGYDNESVATTAMQTTFLMWAFTLYMESYPILLGSLTGVAYFYMVAAWGGYVFVINLIGIHAALLFILQKYPSWDHYYRAYSSFYLVGTTLAVQLPVVGWNPIRSLEQLGPCIAFFGLQFIELSNYVHRRSPSWSKWKARGFVFGGVAIIGAIILAILIPRGYFGPLSSRVRGLFVEHTKTGNPLVDSVAEHQAANRSAYFQYLHDVCFIAPVGFAIVTILGFTPASSFLFVYGIAAYYFSHRMVRLILLAAPIASVLGGIVLGYTWAWIAGSILDTRPSIENVLFYDEEEEEDEQEKQQKSKEKDDVSTGQPSKSTKITKGSSHDSKAKQNNGKKSKNKKELVKKGSKVGKKSEEADDDKQPAAESKDKAGSKSEVVSSGQPIWVRAVRLIISYFIIQAIRPHVEDFREACNHMARAISHPTIIQKGQDRRTGQDMVVDDYREAYWWLRDNTPQDARILAWWDYGYQITGIANRTTIADGNTWNHEHIALLGRILTSPEKEGHRIARHLADYVLLWAGGGGDDLAKSPHLIRIANSVYRGICKEPTCRTFGMMQNGVPTPQLEASLLYKLHGHRLLPDVEADRNRFKEVFMSKHGRVRIFKILKVSQESKEWVENNKVCDAPGSWFCRGQYPPPLQKILAQKRDFKQLEDFNAKGEDDSEYQRQYFENLNRANRGPMIDDDDPRKKRPRLKKLSPEDIDLINEEWEDNEMTTVMWELISGNRFKEFMDVLGEVPHVAHIRSSDGRGPMWWAHEYKNNKMIQVLRNLDVSEDRTDENGISPMDLARATISKNKKK